MVRFLHTADWQLGMRRHFLKEEALPRFMQARIDAIQRMAEIARERKCDFAVVSGDVFESNQVDWRTVGRALEALAAFPCPVYLLPGNHDPLDAATLYKSKRFLDRKPANLHVLTDGAPVPVGDHAEIVGVPWMSKKNRRDQVADAVGRLAPADGRLRICVAHGALDALAPERASAEAISLHAAQQALDERRIHYLALGDHHSVKNFGPRIWYPGTPEPTRATEQKPGYALVVELDGDTCDVEEHGVGRWRFAHVEETIDTEADVALLRDRLAEIDAKDCTVVHLALQGSPGLAAKTALDDLLDEARDLFAAVRADTDLIVLPKELDLSRLQLTGFAQKTVDELAVHAHDDDTARDALALLYRLAQGDRR